MPHQLPHGMGCLAGRLSVTGVPVSTAKFLLMPR
jgi:hypothetical protein